MKPFKLKPKQKLQVNAKEQRQIKTIKRLVFDYTLIIQAQVDKAWNDYERTRKFVMPQFEELYGVTDKFYERTIKESFTSSKEARRVQEGPQKHLAAELPNSLKSLERFFRDSRKWPSIMKRSKKIVDKLRKQYIKKLERKFNSLMPKLERGLITPAEAKVQMMETWRTSKSRVQTIFRTESTRYTEKTQQEFFRDDNEIIGWLFDSVADTSRTDICRSRHGLIYRPGTELLKKNTPGLHWNCRSHLIPLANTAQNRKMLQDPRRDPNKVSVVRLPVGWKN